MPTVSVNYNPTTGGWTFGGNINAQNAIAVARGNNTVTFNLTSPSTAQFATNPFSWPGGQPTCITFNGLSNNNTTTSFSDNNTNPNSGSVSYGFELTIDLNPGASNPNPVTSTDPTIVNEGTGGDGDEDRHGDRDQDGQ